MNTPTKIIAVAGATGHLGKLIIQHLGKKDVQVRALVRAESESNEIQNLTHSKIDIRKIDYDNPSDLVESLKNVSCVISALSGLRDVIVESQSKLLSAAVTAGVQRFIPSDFCIDYTNLRHGHNRNLDLRREFSVILDTAPIKATSILNGMFTDLLIGEAPVVLFGMKRIFFWGDADQRMDFTTIDNTAEYTAWVAAEENTPRFLRIAGDVASMHNIQNAATSATGQKFKKLRPGGLGAFKAIIKITKTLAPGAQETFPAWQGMQYLYDMLSGKAKHSQLDNDRYPAIKWTSVQQVLKRKGQPS
jgi:nucleoside-diphosphate-sugar epimerase